MRRFIMFCAALFLFSFLAQTARAQMNTSLFIEEIKYRRNGALHIDFDDNTVREAYVNWTGREILSVFDKSGAKVPAEVEARGEDWLYIRIPGAIEGETYTFEIRNVNYGARKDIVYTGFFIAASGWEIEYKQPPRFRQQGRQVSESSSEEVFIREIEYDRGGRVEISFGGRMGKRIDIEWTGNEKVTVADKTGREYSAAIREYARNKLGIHILDIVENMDYSMEITNVAFGGETLSFKMDFTAARDWKYRPPRRSTK